MADFELLGVGGEGEGIDIELDLEVGKGGIGSVLVCELEVEHRASVERCFDLHSTVPSLSTLSHLKNCL